MINEFQVVNVMNEAMLNSLKNSNKDYSINLKIQKCLEDKAFFFKVDKATAYKILENVGVRNESLEAVYSKLISPDVFYELLNQGIIQLDDSALIIKYDAYDSNSLFNKKN